MGLKGTVAVFVVTVMNVGFSAVIRKSEENCGLFGSAATHVSSSLLVHDTVAFSLRVNSHRICYVQFMTYSVFFYKFVSQFIATEKGPNNVWCMSRMWPICQTQKSCRGRRKVRTSKYFLTAKSHES